MIDNDNSPTDKGIPGFFGGFRRIVPLGESLVKQGNGMPGVSIGKSMEDDWVVAI